MRRWWEVAELSDKQINRAVEVMCEAEGGGSVASTYKLSGVRGGVLL